MTDMPQKDADVPAAAAISESERRKSLPQAAQRALAEADSRRELDAANALPRELGGRDGPEPVRYGDWEKKGLAVDF
jgi:hypothetical protein